MYDTAVHTRCGARCASISMSLCMHAAATRVSCVRTAHAYTQSTAAAFSALSISTLAASIGGAELVALVVEATGSATMVPGLGVNAPSSAPYSCTS